MSFFVHSVLPIGTPEPINMELVVTFEKFEHQRVKIEANGRFQIMFIRKDRLIGEKVSYWKYAKECDRDHDFDELVKEFSKTLN